MIKWFRMSRFDLRQIGLGVGWATEVLRGADRSLRAAEGHGGAEQGAPRRARSHGGHDLAAGVLPAAPRRNVRRMFFGNPGAAPVRLLKLIEYDLIWI